MQRRSFLILVVTALVAVVLVAIGIPGKRPDSANQAGTSLFEGLSDRINDIDRVSVRGAGDQLLVSLVRGAQSWTITELSSYPADWSKVREVLTGIAWATVTETKTSNPEYFVRLGVEDIKAEDASGLLLEIGVGDDQYGLILGREAESRGGQYVRIAGSDQSYLISEVIDLPATPIAWADDIIVDVGSGLVAEVNIEHADGERLTASRVSADDGDFSLHDVPEGRETLAAWAINRLGGVFSLLRMEEARPASRFSGTAVATVRVLTFAGLELTAEVFETEGSAWIGLEAGRHESAVLEGDATEPPEGETEDPAQNSLASEVAEINQRTRGWVFKVSQSKYEDLVKRIDDFLKAVGDTPDPSGQ